MKQRRFGLILSIILMMGATCAQGQIYNYLFSTDIGSDLDASDPYTQGSMDAGAIYTPRGNPGSPLQWKDDDSSTIQWQGYPLASAPQPAPGQIGTSTISQYSDFFDLDAEDQVIDEHLANPNNNPTSLNTLEQGGIYSIRRSVKLSYDDDGAAGWAASGDVPVTVPPDHTTEIYGTTLTIPPPGSTTANPEESESNLQLGPDPLPTGNDDDVDALDWHPLEENPNLSGSFQARYFSPDHEANMGMDPGDIYLTLRNSGQNVTLAFDDVNNIGVPDSTDVDAFELVAVDEEWGAVVGLTVPAGQWAVAAIFSVDEDDPDTPSVDESGGLNPNIIYLTDLQGNYAAASGAYGGDIDALAVPEPGVLSLVGIFGIGLLAIRRIFAL